MSAVDDAMQAVLDAQHNTLGLANPGQAQSEAQTAWMQAVTAALSGGVPATTAVETQSAAPDVAALVQAAVEAQLPALEQQIAAAFGKLLTAQPVAPALAAVVSTQEAPPATEPPTITPTNPGA
ncbi:hypothetical protein P3T24_004376 [Paraburkholderia sp. GAS33]|uniref:hypothetical protein n=1 Tax=Paraburkholderia sp. GAS33 TaxID=3035130 RepID=UPI003D21722B